METQGIAADSGRATSPFAWDSYRNGNYDVLHAHRPLKAAWGSGKKKKKGK